MKKLRRMWNSLRAKVFSIVFFTCIPVLLLLIWVNYYSISLIEQRIYENDYDILSLNMNLLDGELNRVSSWLINETAYRQDTNEFASSDVNICEYAAQRYKKLLQEDMMMFSYIEGIACYSVQNGRQVYGMFEYASGFEERMQVLTYAREHASELMGSPGVWITRTVGDRDILICAAGDEKALFYAWTSFDTLAVSVSSWKLEDGVSCVMTSLDGAVHSSAVGEELLELDYSGELDGYYYAGERNAYMITGVESMVGDFRMMAVVDRSRLFGTFYLIRAVVIVVLGVFLLFLLPWLYRSLHRSVFEPIDRMETGMTQIEGGNLDIQIASGRSSNEMAHLIDSFNDMVRQIQTLKIQVYEDELDKRQLELDKQQLGMDYLQLQLEPHFYLNALNLVNLMAQAGDVDLIPQLTENLSAYLRYLAGTRGGKTTLREELEHIGHYLKIMEIRLGNNFCYEPVVEEGLLETEIPPLMLQLLVENSMKYAFDITGENHISLTVKSEGQEIVCVVQDNGNGYPAEYIERFEKGEPPVGKHIGLWNLGQRLEFIYGDRVVFRISNVKPKGARSEIRIPGEENR